MMLGAFTATSNARDVIVGTISNQSQHIRSTTIGRTITAVYTATAIHTHITNEVRIWWPWVLVGDLHVEGRIGNNFRLASRSVNRICY